MKINEGAITLRMYAWAKDPVTARRMHYDLNEAMLRIFNENNIPFALPIRRSVQSDHHPREPAPPWPSSAVRKRVCRPVRWSP
ncbi:MAG: hypothetical protein IPO60_12135 [Flavobacteriales bacterium]|nr:hypothetical protein [Flavobacteriales bacterium]